jgi:outer membrane protein assembly factor BamA
VRGGFFQTTLHRRLGGRWYGGVLLRYLDITQDLDLRDVENPIDYDGEIQSAGIGLDIKRDSRDLPTNPWKGHLFEARAITSDMRPSTRGRYQNYSLRFRTYHKLTDRMVLAGDASYCTRSGDFPLWDSCWLTLRGFPITRYMAKTAFQVQAEARWTLSKRWGVVAFAGAGDVKDPITAEPEDSFVPSYGAGIRFMVLPSQRLNVRVDYGRSSDGEGAWYLSVAEAF